jgi:hypothetical protein
MSLFAARPLTSIGIIAANIAAEILRKGWVGLKLARDPKPLKPGEAPRVGFETEIT